MLEGRWAAVPRRAALMAVAMLLGGWSVAAPRAGASVASCEQVTASGATTFSITGNTGCVGSFVVPSGVASVSVRAVGAPGGAVPSAFIGSHPGLGADVSTIIPVKPGETLFAVVGGDGGQGDNQPGGSPGFNGGGQGGSSANSAEFVGGGGGGGASDVRTVSPLTTASLSLGTRLVIAGGGGGEGGTLTGGNADESAPTSAGGGGATGGSGGAGGVGDPATQCSNQQPGVSGSPGSYAQGGAGAPSQVEGGGGGGGGLYGGGGGAGNDPTGSCTDIGGGGGGASYLAPSASNATYATAAGGQVPLVTITPSSPSVLPQGPTGPQGPAGATGPAGPQGPTGPRGAPGQIELVTCVITTKTVTRHGKRRKVSQRRCSTKLVSSPIKFTVAGTHLALQRGSRLYATGSARVLHGQQVLNLTARATLRPGRYEVVRYYKSRHLRHTRLGFLDIPHRGPPRRLSR